MGDSKYLSCWYLISEDYDNINSITPFLRVKGKLLKHTKYRQSKLVFDA